MTDRQHYVPQWYLRNFSSNDAVQKAKSRIYLMSNTSFDINERIIKKIAYLKNYLENDADASLSANENVASQLTSELVNAKFSEEIIFAYLNLIDNKLNKNNTRNYEEFCKFIHMLEMRSPYMRKLIENGFQFDILSKEEVIGSGWATLSPEGLKNIHSRVITNKEYDFLAQLESQTYLFKEKEYHLDNEKIKKLLNSHEYEEFKRTKTQKRSNKDGWKYYAQFLPLIVLNKSGLNFVTSQNPIIKTTFSGGDIEIDKSYFFPISPKIGLLLVEHEIFQKYSIKAVKNKDPFSLPFTLQLFETKEVLELNYTISKLSEETYSSDEKSLNVLILKYYSGISHKFKR